MPALSFVAAQAESVVGHLPEARQSALTQALAGLCEIRWRELRGPEPDSMLAHALWSVTPPLADLFVDMYAAGDRASIMSCKGTSRCSGWRCWCWSRSRTAMPKARALHMRR